uniref:MADF domain-containing protein n=1 Tax=Graphocephala atropunctata TaxID=36148 RepID=A0A1B6MQM8_9HEMI
MSIRHLITEVQQRPSLWNNKDPEFYNRSYNDRVWDIVAETVQMPKLSAKNKWKNLKDSFVKAVKNGGRRSEGGSSVDPNKWPHFTSLLFLMECVAPEHLQHLPADMELPSNGAVGEAEEQDHMAQEIPLDVQVRSSRSRARRRTAAMDPEACDSLRKTSKSITNDLEIQNIASFGSEIFKNDNRMIEILQEPEDDYDLHFLKSLVPFFKDMTSVQKLRVRSRLINVIAEELASTQT